MIIMNVALLDDDAEFLDTLKRRLTEFNCDVYAYTKLVDMIDSNVPYDIAFIDIELGENDTGFNAVQFLKNRNKKCVIAFFTNYNKYAIKGYNYQPFRYILKTQPDTSINRQLIAVFNEYHRRNKKITGSYNGYTFSTSLDDVYYISISNHIATLHTTKCNFEIYRQMKDLENELNEFGFFRCHHSYMVNIQHIYVMRSDFVFILDDSNRSDIPIGIRYRKQAEDKFLNNFMVGV